MAQVNNLHYGTNKTYGSCAIAELGGIVSDGNAEKTIQSAAQAFFSGDRNSVYIFSCRKTNSEGEALRKYIEEHSLGRVVKQKAFQNYRYGDTGGAMIVLYLWYIDLQKYKNWWEKNKPPVKAPVQQAEPDEVTNLAAY